MRRGPSRRDRPEELTRLTVTLPGTDEVPVAYETVHSAASPVDLCVLTAVRPCELRAAELLLAESGRPAGTVRLARPQDPRFGVEPPAGGPLPRPWRLHPDGEPQLQITGEPAVDPFWPVPSTLLRLTFVTPERRDEITYDLPLDRAEEAHDPA